MAKTLGDLLVGARVVDPNTKYYGVPIVWRIMEHNHEGDPENSTAVISDKVLCLKAFDAREPKRPGSGQVASDIREHGNGNYDFSNILQWANSDADAWMWYTPQHEYDHPPDTTDYVTVNAYESETGFLNKFSVGFKESMLDVTKKIGTDVTRKIHLPTLRELGGADRYSPEDSSLKVYELFSDDASRKADITKEAAEKDSGRYDSYWTATQDVGCEVRAVYKTGKTIYVSSVYESPNRGKAWEGDYYGFRPYCCLKKDIMVSDKPDENGVYTLFLRSTPDLPYTPDNPDEPESPDYPETNMDGIWRIPKIDWTETDAFNLKDYKRIRNNLLFLRNKISGIWGAFNIADMGNDQSDPKYIWKVQYFNAIEENLEIINKRMIIIKNYGFKQTFYDNGAFIRFSELNRIESATLQMKQIIEGWEAGLRRISFRLAAPKGLYL